ncbi:MAG: sigma-70 family RNA polymerase sigma factor [Bryobacterales bacterium]|nr:sigma-70 family RNA polymerase sigma factor [Bryobacterales bacterium]
MQKGLPENSSTLEKELVRRAQQGDAAAFAELLGQNQKSSKRLALSILRNSDEAEDEIQTAYAKAIKHIGTFQQESKFSTWLNRIVANQCLMRLRKLRRERPVFLNAETEEGTVFELPSTETNPEQALGRRQLALAVNAEISRIPPLMRDVVVLRDVEELPMEEVAARLGITVSAAKSRLLRARAELRQRMERHTGRLGLRTLTA